MSKTKRTTKTIAIDKEIGARIRLRRRSIGMVQRDLADALNVTFQQVQKYETGQSTISAAMLMRVAEILKASVSSFLPDPSSASRKAAPIKPPSKSAIQLMEAHAGIRSSASRRMLLTIAKKFAAEPAVRRHR